MSRRPVITSRSNPRLRAAAALRDASARRASGLTLVDGGREVRRAVLAGLVPEEMFLDDTWLAAALAAGPERSAATADGLPTGNDLEGWLGDLESRGTRVIVLGRDAFSLVAYGDRNEGCVGVVPFRERTLDTFTPAPDLPVMIVEGVEKPGNLGAILRTVDAAGLGGVVACGSGTDAANPATIRASLGTVFSVPLARATTDAAIDFCRTTGRRVVAASPGATTRWHAADLTGRVAMLLGSEADGVSPAWREAGAAGRIVIGFVSLPMHGLADSLNVAATAAILAYESVRQADALRD